MQQAQNNQRGVATHLQKFYTIQLSACQIPSINLLNSLNKISQIIERRQQSIELQLQSREQISSYLSFEEASQLHKYKEKLKQNEQILKIVQICREIDIRILKFQENIQAVDFDQFHRLKCRLRDFKELYGLIGQLDEQFVRMEQQNQAAMQNNKKKQYQNVSILRNKYFTQLKTKLYKAIIQLFYSHNRNTKLQASLEYFHLPIKKQQKIPQLAEDPAYNISDQKYLSHAYCIIQALFCQYCYYCLQKKIDMMLGEDQQQIQIQRINININININQNKSNEQNSQHKQFVSQFFNQLWRKINKSIIYIFISPNVSNETNAYQIDEPNWLFQHMEKIFKLNYNFINDNILKLLKNDSQTKQITDYIHVYFVAYNITNFFLKFIILRLQTDLKILKQSQKQDKKQTSQQRNKSAFIIFNFLDQLHKLSQQIYQNYQYESNFIQSVLLWSEKNSNIDILSLNFDYQHHWMQLRIFNDFSNINYSSVTDLKNVQAYNITVNFTHIFEKLYSKFRKINDESLKTKINQFYYDKLLQLVRHITTSFERIYNYSGIDKYQTLISYKKVQDQFRGYFHGFIQQSPVFQQKINQEYYSVLEKYVTVLALEELNSVHKKIYKKLSDKNDYFTKITLQAEELGKNKADWNKIFSIWQQKMNKINKLLPNYEDKKLRNIFFVFLESIQFSEDGFLYFITLFQPFLVVLFTIQGAKIIKMLLEMEKGAFKQYCKSHQNNLWFLSSAELNSLQRTKIKVQNK